MSKSRIIISIFIMLFINQAIVKCQWQQSLVVKKGFVSAIAVQDSIIFLGGFHLSDSLVSYFYSSDYGKTWSERFNNKASHPNAIVIKDKYIFAGEGFEGGNIFRSSDWGLNWEILHGLPIEGITALANNDNRLFAGMTSDYGPVGVWMSSDNGNTWTRAWEGKSFSNGSIIALDSLVFVGTFGSGIYGSSDYGKNWEPYNNGFPLKTYVNVLQVFQNNIFAGTAYLGLDSKSEGIYYTTNFGLNWNSLNDGLNYYDIQALTSDDKNLFSATFSNVFILQHEKMKWYDITLDLPGIEIHSLAICGDNLFLGSNNGLWFRSISGISTEVDKEILFLKDFVLYQNYPNPFNPTTKIKFTVPTSPQPSPYQVEGASLPAEQAEVRLSVYDILGNEVATLVNEEKSSGEYELEFNWKNLSSGIYFYQLSASGGVGSFIETKKMCLIK